jgi:hypothetical protein
MVYKTGKCSGWRFCKSIFTAVILAGVVSHVNAPSSAAATGCLSSSGSWVSAALSQTESASFRITYDATPSAAAIDSITGLSSGAATNFSDLAVGTRFNASGVIDVRNGSVFTAASRVPYSAGVAYHFILDVNVATHTYSAYVVVRSVQTTLGSNILFRSTQASVRSLGHVAVHSNTGGLSVCNISLAGSGNPTLLLNPNPSSLNFGSVSVSSSKEQTITLTNAGTSNVTISKVAVAGAGFNASGAAAGLVLSPKQSTTVRATFAPSATGTHSGALTVSSNAQNSPAGIALVGVGVSTAAHRVSLSWNVSSGVAGYNVYVASTSGGPYSQVNSTLLPATSYVDYAVQSGRSYYYVVTAVSPANVQSGHSAEIKATVP